MDNLRDLIGEKKDLEILMRERKIALKASVSDGMPKAKTLGNPTEREALKTFVLMERWREKCDEIDDIIAEVESILETLPAIQRRIIRLYYYRHFEDRRIAKAVRLSADVVGRKRREALKELTSHAEK